MMKYASAVELALEGLKKADPVEVARLAGGRYEAAGRTVTIEHCGRPVSFGFDGQSLVWGDSGQPFDPAGSIPVLHYLLSANGAWPGGELVPYRDLWGAKTQSGPFIARPGAVLAAEYGRNPGAVLARGQALGAAISEKFGDARLDIRVFPLVPVTVLLYAADEEMTAEATFLFDTVIRQYLPTEDVAWVAADLAEKLSGAAI